MIINKIDNLKKNFIQSSVEDIQDPLALSFGIRFEYYDNLIQGESLQQGLLNGLARKFFTDRNDTLRVQKLDYFIQMLKYFSEEKPWYFKSISGLDTLMEIDIQNGARISKNSSILLNATDSIDMKMLSMVDSYRSIVYDKKFMRELLPTNLRKFNCSVYVTDPRTILRPTSPNDTTLKVDEDAQGVLVLKCYGCSFDFNMDNYIGVVENTNPNNQDPSIRIKINVDRVYEAYNLPTNMLYGYGGVGYFSDDYQNDYNFATNILRPPSIMVSEYGNAKDIDRNGVQVFRDEINKIVNETAESFGIIDDTIPFVPIEGIENSTTIETLEKLSNVNKTDITLQELTSLENATNIEKVTLETFDNVSIIEKLETLSSQNSTNIENISNDSIPNETSLNNENVLSNPNGSEISIETVTSVPNGTNINIEDILSNPNGSEINIEDILSNPNGSEINIEDIKSFENSTSIENISKESISNETSIGFANIESFANLTEIQNISIESNPNETFLENETLFSTPNKFPLNPTKLEVTSNFLKTLIGK